MGERVVIEHPQRGGPWAISSAQYDPDRHKLWVENVTEGYRVEKDGPWYKIIGPEGEKVGKATMDKDEADARLRELEE